ncbi:MAG: peptide chain release factor N(5)-glutamine methyltransferase [Proteobacteria bacterium]|nr:peptide chain release factor N(5)-glutamine methyltransferase [Pseudomonadota bacterium]
MIATREILQQASERLLKAQIESPRLEARLLLAHALGTSSVLDSRQRISESERARFQILLERRLAREPLAYITGIKEFWSLEFEVGPGVLVPRPETELMLEEVERRYPDRDAPLAALDLGTGSGAILISFLKSYPRALGLGVDISVTALNWARRNAAKHGVAARSRFNTGDWAQGVQETFDLVFANPPYVDDGDMAVLAPEVGRHEPHVALKGGRDGLDAYQALGPQIARCLKAGGQALIELGQGQAKAVQAILEAAKLRVDKVLPDLAGIPRCLVAALDA